MRPRQRIIPSDERGIALLLTLLLALLVVSLAIGVLLMMTSTTLVTRYHQAETVMSNLAAAGLEQARDTLNGTPSLLPRPNGFVTLEPGVALRDADNVVIPGLTRSTYAGLTGGATGQAGLFTTVLSVISNARGPVVIRRADYLQKSFAAYERFYGSWSTGSWGAEDMVYGPVHSNGDIRLSGSSPGTHFWGRVTAVNTIQNLSNGHFYAGYQTGVSTIPFPTAAQVGGLQPIAASANLLVAGDGRANATDPEVRIEFVAIDLNGDGDTSDENEGFFRVFRAPPAATQEQRNYVTARRWGNVFGWPGGTSNSSDPNLISPNCGGEIRLPLGRTWMTAEAIVTQFGSGTAAARDSVRAALTSDQRRCYLGGDRNLFGGLWATTTTYGTFSSWTGWGGSPPAALVAAITAEGVDTSTNPLAVAQTFWPVSRSYNPASRDVIYVTGSVAVSGRLRGRVTLAATGNIMLADDLSYVQAPNTTCADILGLVSRESILLEDNNVNSPFRVAGTSTALFDDTMDETIHGFLLSLESVSGENLGSGEIVVDPESCGGGNSSRGCRFLVGGIAQPFNNLSYNGSTGWRDQDSYDQCGTLSPPPYFPTTGQFSKYRYLEIDPVGFDATAWFSANQ